VTPVAFARLFPEFRGESWAAWRVILARLGAEVREFYAICGRGSGKSRIVALLAACFATREYPRAPGERIYVGVFAPDRKQARITFRYTVGLLRSVPELAALIERETAESVDLRNGMTIEVITASRAAPRGRAYALVIVEEAAFLPVGDSANPDTDLIVAVRPALARVRGSLLAVVTSPYARRGVPYQAERKYGEVAPPHVVYVRKPTVELNSTFDAAEIARAYEEDPTSAAAEYGAEFRTDVETYVSREVVDDAVVPGRHELPPAGGVEYAAFCDPSGGSGSDSFTLAIGYCEDDRFVLAAIRERRPPFSPDSVVDEYAALLKKYGVREVVGDRWAGNFPRDAMSKRGVEYVVAERTKSDLYRDALPLLNSGRVELLDHARMVAQICALERRTARGGKDTIDHPPDKGSGNNHDDIANSVLALCATLAAEGEVSEPLLLFSGRGTDGSPGYLHEDPPPTPHAWSPAELAEVGVYEVNGVWTHSLGDEHAARIVSGVITREEALRAMRRRRADEFAMLRGRN
jgi:hypothetical protein